MNADGDRPNQVPPSVIESRIWICQNCWHYSRVQDGSAEPVILRILEISEVDAGWLAHGHVEKQGCAWCGATYKAVTEYIPIECAEYDCRRCGPKSRMVARVVKLAQSESGYLFVATLRCDRCKARQRLQRILRPLWGLKRVKVGPTGVEVEREIAEAGPPAG